MLPFPQSVATFRWGCVDLLIFWMTRVLGVGIAVLPTVAQPDNDHFSRREVIQGNRPSVVGFTVDASLEPEELVHTRGVPGEGSVWWEWTAPGSGRLVIRAGFWNGFWEQAFTARMMLFEGAELTSLRLVAETTSRNRLEAEVEEGRTYSLAVIGPYFRHSFFGFVLDFVLPAPPSNDSVSTPTLLAGDYLEAEGTTRDATPDDGSVHPRVWWEWTAPRDGLAFVKVRNPNLHVTFDAWPQDSFNPFGPSQTRRSSLFDDRFGLVEPSDRFVWEVQQGVTYIIAATEDPLVTPQDFWFQLVLSDAGIQADPITLVTDEVTSLRITLPSSAVGFREALLHSSDGLTLTNTNPEAAFLWSSSRSGWFSFQAVVVDSLGQRWPATNEVGFRVLKRQLVPANDLFVDRALLAARSNLVLALDEAGVEPGEPSLGNRSVWFEWRPDTDGRLIVSSAHFGSPYLRIEAFEGTTLADLRSVSGRVTTNSWLRDWEFSTTAGQPVFVRISTDTRLDMEIPLAIAGGPVPPHDRFADRVQLPSGSFRITDDNRLATVEPGEPGRGMRTLWYNWVAPAQGVLNVPRRLTPFGTITVYSGSLWPPQVMTPHFSDWYPVGEQINYLIVVSGPEFEVGQGLDVGGIFTFEGNFFPSPPNDSFTRPLALTGERIEFSGNLAGAQPASPQPFLQRNFRYLWYEWQAPEAGDVLVSVNPEFAGELVVVAMDQPGMALTTQTHPGQWLFAVQEGTRYRLGVGNAFGQSNAFDAQLSLRRALRNDTFAERILLTGTRSRLRGSHLQSGMEPSEPLSPIFGLGSVWWSWTAPRTGWVALRSPDLPPLKVFIGNRLEDLVEITTETERFYEWPHEARFEASEGTTYHFAVYGDPHFLFDFVIDLDLSTFRISTPTNVSALTLGQNVQVEVVAPDADVDGVLTGSASIVRYPRVESELGWAPLMGNIPTIPGSGALEYFFPPTVSFRLRATNHLGEVRLSQPVSVFVRPANDALAQAELVEGTNWTAVINLVGSTLENQEPGSGAEAGIGSVWFRWRAPETGHVGVVLSASDGKTAELKVYEGTALSPLHEAPVWSDREAVAFPTTRGVNYYFQIKGPTSLSFASLQVESFPYRIVVPGPEIPRLSEVALELVTDRLAEQIASVRYLADSFSTGPATSPPYRVVPNSLPPTGSVWVRARIDFKDGTIWEPFHWVLLRWRPDNDDLVGAPYWNRSVEGLVGTAEATLEPGEPRLDSGDRSLWWIFEALEDGFIRLTSDNPALLLEVFSTPDPTTWNGSTRWVDPAPMVVVPVQQGQKLQIRLSSAGSAHGSIDFRFSTVGTNIVPELAPTLPSSGGPVVAEFGPSSGQFLNWWIVPERSGNLILDLASPVSGDFRWRVLKEGEDAGSDIGFPVSHVPVEAGQRYLLQLWLAPPGFGTFIGNVRIQEPYQNDTFDRRLALPPAGIEGRFFFGETPSDPHEPGIVPGMPLEHLRTLWFSWFSPVRQRVYLQGGGAEVWVFAGDSLDFLQPVPTSSFGFFEFMAESNQTYLILVRGQSWWSAGVALGLYPLTPPANDDFSQRIPLTGNQAVLKVAHAGATREWSEPWHGGRPSFFSSWWSWTAPDDGILTLTRDTNPAGDLWLGLYRGDRLMDLVPAISDSSALSDQVVELPVMAREVIQIAVASSFDVPLREVFLGFHPPASPEDHLTIVNLGTELELRWPARPGGVVLETSGSLAAPDWQPLPPAVEGTALRIPFSADSARYFRLRPD